MRPPAPKSGSAHRFNVPEILKSNLTADPNLTADAVDDLSGRG